MARKSKTTKEKTTETPTAKEAKAEPKYGVNDLAEASGLQAASVRVALRDLEVEKNFGNKYGWDTQKDFKEVVAALKERSAKSVTAKAAPVKKGKTKK